MSKAIDLSVHFSSGKVTSETFYITFLDSLCLIILGYSWLSLHNPLIDWVTGSINFWTTPHRMPLTLLTSPPPLEPIAMVEPHPPTFPKPSTDNPVPNISLINAVALCQACKLEGSTQFSIYLRPSGVDLHFIKNSHLKVWTCSEYLWIVMGLWMSLMRERLVNFLLIVHMISRSIWRKDPPHPSELFIPYLQ